MEKGDPVRGYDETFSVFTLLKDTFFRPDPRDPDYTRSGIFIHHNCWKCQDGNKPCAKGNPIQCEFPRARND